jgi:hypothetical protein
MRSILLFPADRRRSFVDAAAAGALALDISPPAKGNALEEACRVIRREGFSGLVTAAAGEIPAINRAFGAI